MHTLAGFCPQDVLLAAWHNDTFRWGGGEGVEVAASALVDVLHFVCSDSTRTSVHWQAGCQPMFNVQTELVTHTRWALHGHDSSRIKQ
jgi:hypothetical protein